MFCQGQLLPIDQFTALFALLGTTYGGNGTTTFALPDLRGRAPVGMGQGPGLTPRNEGEQGGAETVALTVTQIPSHTHAAVCTTNGGNQTDPTGHVWARELSGITAEYQTAAPDTNLAPAAVGSTGGGTAHNNLQPHLPMNFAISLFGIFPSRA
jgi:microcystin-dependent protein